jgi:hypothetical protein
MLFGGAKAEPYGDIRSGTRWVSLDEVPALPRLAAAGGLRHAAVGTVWPPASTGYAFFVSIYRAIRTLT